MHPPIRPSGFIVMYKRHITSYTENEWLHMSLICCEARLDSVMHFRHITFKHLHMHAFICEEHRYFI